MNKVMRSLYFKLNEENPKHQAIIRFFDKVKSMGCNKVDVLYYMVRMEDAASHIVTAVNTIEAIDKKCEEIHAMNEKQD